MNKSKITIIVLLALLTLAAAGCLLSLAYSTVRGASRQDRTEKQAAFQQQEKDFQALHDEHAEWKKLPRELRRFRRERLFNLENYAAFRRDLNLWLDDNGFPAPALSLNFGPSRFRMRSVSLKFTLNGPYRSVKKFIYDMENKPRLHFFNRVEMSGSGDKVVAHFLMEVYLAE